MEKYSDIVDYYEYRAACSRSKDPSQSKSLADDIKFK